VRDHRFRQLDAVRAFAVLAVVACHTFDAQRDGWAEFGANGVQLFFVISGFLISGILIDARRDATALGQPITGVFRAFYARRALRIFPVYYLTLAIGALVAVQGMRENLGWNLLYLSNWQIAFDGHWGTVTHIWSLAVEEQFYLLWPLVVLLAPRRLLPWVIGSMLVVALATRALLTASTDMWSDGIAILTPSVLDSLGLGALLALLWRGSSNVDRIVTWIGALAVAVFALGQVADHLLVSLPDVSAVTNVWWSLLFVWVVHNTARGVHGPVARLLTWRPLVYIGTVSYGVYLFHLFVVPVAGIVERKVGVNLPIPAPGLGRFVVVAIVSIAVAALSWTFIERPINEQKHRFPYVRADEASVSRRALASPIVTSTAPVPDTPRV
jgi:peptidoglycan/LPS O-acetylase OafA/YrhL